MGNFFSSPLVAKERYPEFIFRPPPPPKVTCLQRFLWFFKCYWKAFLVIVVPLALLPLPILYQTPKMRCAYVVLIMAVYWILELLPLEVTSMLPIVLFPTMGILDSDKTCAAYMKETNMMFLGGLMIAAGVQHSKLPSRVALLTVRCIGCSHYKLTFGISLVTMMISMWISNAATTTMIVPIAHAILEVFERQGYGPIYHPPRQEPETDPKVAAASITPPLVPTDITICYYLAISFASTIGGIGTLVGTVTNPAFKGIYESEFPESHGRVSFLWYMLYSAPSMLVLQAGTWLSLMFTFMGMFRPRSAAAERAKKASEGSAATLAAINEQYKALGPWTFHEIAAGLLFILSIFMYVFRKPGFMQGWAGLLSKTTSIKDGVTSIFIVICMFLIPMSPLFLRFFSPSATYDQLKNAKASPGLVTWRVLQNQVPWGLMFLLGGGFALADGSKATGLSATIGKSLIGLGSLDHLTILFAVVALTQFITEFTSNVAICNLVVPVLANMAKNIKGLDPLYLMLPACHACSMTFLMPVGTPCNAIVAGLINMPTSKMALGGIIPKLISTVVVWGTYPLYGQLLFGKEGD